MTLQEFYDSINGDYNEILGRLAQDERIKRFLLKFLDTNDMEMLKLAWGRSDADQIFAYAHRLKGIALNLSLTRFSNLTSDLTEQYRDGVVKDINIATTLYEQICEEYNVIESNIKKLV